ncbi:hypothetical protein D3C87_897720 [compost metagenome]
MSFLKGNTKWVLFLASDQQAEERHILDLAYGVCCLEAAGVSPANIHVYVDGPDRSRVAQWFAHGSATTYQIKTSADFFADQMQNASDDLVMFVTGHGCIDGLPAVPAFVRPTQLLNSLKQSPQLKRAVVYFGQCDAGIFNYMPIGRKPGTPATQHDPDVIFVGATNLHFSISSSTQETFVSGQLPWQANLFLLYVFKWISRPVDVDGDGQLTIMDSYKFAGAQSNAANRRVKNRQFYQSMGLHDRFEAAQLALQADPTDAGLQFAMDTAQQEYVDALNLQFNHQESWILNSRPAQDWHI